MYFVTSKKAGYVLFCMTPSGRAALGLTEEKPEGQKVHLFERGRDGQWNVLREWNAAERSHTDVLIALGDHDEPDDPKRLLDLLGTS